METSDRKQYKKVTTVINDFDLPSSSDKCAQDASCAPDASRYSPQTVVELLTPRFVPTLLESRAPVNIPATRSTNLEIAGQEFQEKLNSVPDRVSYLEPYCVPSQKVKKRQPFPSLTRQEPLLKGVSRLQTFSGSGLLSRKMPPGGAIAVRPLTPASMTATSRASVDDTQPQVTQKGASSEGRSEKRTCLKDANIIRDKLHSKVANWWRKVKGTLMKEKAIEFIACW
ncbi:hypothetical protein BC830DRAFT_652696 [Chytriomyces sp. MP71]|nr:hypothetical protein BC830DRAFT_962926 [Chytriomyces sp. MP71]KAI8611500.1 hypothetical protein BC830DRAFT_652696 [Chytriomyces sp. MP71]